MKLPARPGSLIKDGGVIYFKRTDRQWINNVNSNVYSDRTFANSNFEVIYTPAITEPVRAGAVVVNDKGEIFVRHGKRTYLDLPWWDCHAECYERWSRIVEPVVKFEGIE